MYNVFISGEKKNFFYVKLSGQAHMIQPVSRRGNPRKPLSVMWRWHGVAAFPNPISESMRGRNVIRESLRLERSDMTITRLKISLTWCKPTKSKVRPVTVLV